MPSKKFEELSAKSVEELQTELIETRDYLQKLKFDHALKGLENPLVLRTARRDVARINTELRRREVAEMSAEELAARSNIRKRRKNK